MTDPKPNPSQPKNAVLAILGAACPVFQNCLPLAIGIHKAIQERFPEIDKQSLRSALRIHTASTRYLKALVQGECRFDLAGEKTGPITPEQKQQAKDTLRERYKKTAERKKAEQLAQQRQENLHKLVEKFNSR